LASLHLRLGKFLCEDPLKARETIHHPKGDGTAIDIIADLETDQNRR
jgi:hypothetical protein